MNCYHYDNDYIKDTVARCRAEFEFIKKFFDDVRQWLRKTTLILCTYPPHASIERVRVGTLYLVMQEGMTMQYMDRATWLLESIYKKYLKMMQEFFLRIKKLFRDTNYTFIIKDTGVGIIVMRVMRDIQKIPEPSKFMEEMV
ncbi:MAG: hypothetical protein ACTSRA_00155 [Promethearchaeota archaeon]|nr:MAG: hypothetical protein [Helarchaeota virus Nidhogg Meg22_1214]